MSPPSSGRRSLRVPRTTSSTTITPTTDQHSNLTLSSVSVIIITIILLLPLSFFLKETLNRPSILVSQTSQIISPLSSSLSPALLGRTLARAVSSQCGRIFIDAMPSNTHFYDYDNNMTQNKLCPDAALSSSLALRGKAPQEQKHRKMDDGLSDGNLTLPNCAPRWYAPHEACDLLTRAGQIIIMGDSLSRHLTIALKMILSGNFALGAYVGGGSVIDNVDEVNGCACDEAFGRYHKCHAIADPKGKTARLLCPNWETHTRLTYLPWWGDYWNDAEIKMLVNVTQKAILVDEIGPAFTDWTSESPDVALHLKRVQEVDSVSRICYLSTAVDDEKKPSFTNGKQNDIFARAVNEKVRKSCVQAGSRVLDGYALTKGDVWSSDGTHFQAATNVVNAMVLLNVIENIVTSRGD